MDGKHLGLHFVEGVFDGNAFCVDDDKAFDTLLAVDLPHYLVDASVSHLLGFAQRKKRIKIKKSVISSEERERKSAKKKKKKKKTI